jgi:hypothetical protein
MVNRIEWKQQRGGLASDGGVDCTLQLASVIALTQAKSKELPLTDTDVSDCCTAKIQNRIQESNHGI